MAGGIFHDPEVYAKPDDFNPDRWLQDDAKSDYTYNLVFGTARVCVCHCHRFEDLFFATASLPWDTHCTEFNRG